jgi:hypothetical protein
MAHCKTFLSDETIYKLKLIDNLNHHFNGTELERENIMNTKEGFHIISLTPSVSNLQGTENAERIITIKTPEESRVETHRVSTVRELADILIAEFGVSVLYGEEKVDCEKS